MFPMLNVQQAQVFRGRIVRGEGGGIFKMISLTWNSVFKATSSLCLKLVSKATPVCSVASVLSDSLQPHGPLPTRLLCPLSSPGKNTGVGCHFFLQGIFLTQGEDALLLHWQANSLPHEPPGKPLQKQHKSIRCKG